MPLFLFIPRFTRKNCTEQPTIKSPIAWSKIHQRVVGIAILIFGIYLSTLTGTITHFVLPGVSAIGGGAAAGAGVGMLTYLVLGTVGAVTGGVGVALGILAMSFIGGGVGIIGAVAGGAGFRTLTYSLVSPWLWIPIMVLGIYISLGVGKQKNLHLPQAGLKRVAAPPYGGKST